VTLSDFLIAHGSALILPLAVVEGPVVTIVTGFLAAQGYFDRYCALLLLTGGDVVGDLVYYWIGSTSIKPLTLLRQRIGLDNSVTYKLQHDLAHNATTMLFVGKWTHTVGCLVLIGSGMLRMPLQPFILANLLAGIPKTVVLFSVGYFAADHYPILERQAVLGATVTGAVGIAWIVVILRRTGRISSGSINR
jgi:membrane-associated protein